MEPTRYIPLISDYGFKATFGNEADTLFLRTALQALICSETPIKEVQFEKNAFEAVTVDGRSGIYDLACTDENGHHFIVEMQLAHSPHFIQRMKFYPLHKFNTLVERGQFDYGTLPRIYCIAFLHKSQLPTASYHSLANLRTAMGELLDSQMTFVTVELAKFGKASDEVTSVLDKLIFTMKTLHTVTETTQYPPFWDEEWLKRAIDELDTRQMTPEERFQFARLTAINAEAVNAERERLRGIVRNLLELGTLTPAQIAAAVGVSAEVVANVQAEMQAPQ